MTRPLHFFGGLGALGMLVGRRHRRSGCSSSSSSPASTSWACTAPIFVIAGVLILAGMQMIGIGLLGELQVRHFFTHRTARPTPWSALCA